MPSMTKKHHFILLFFIVLTAFFNAGAKDIHKEKNKAHKKAPSFEATAVNGQKIKLEDYKGSILLLSFIDIHGSIQKDKKSETLAQLTFLKSMKRQHEHKGLKIILVDASVLSSKDEVINFMYDNGLEETPLLFGNKIKNIAKNYKVQVNPTTFLIGKTGIINQIWEHVALSSQLAIAFNSLVADQGNMTSDWDTKPQTIFPGFTLARKLSDEIWLLDDGRKWNTKNTPVRFLVLNDEDVHIKLEAINNANNKKNNLLDTELVKLPKEESKVLMQNMPAKYKGICGGLFSVSLKTSGQYILKATVFDKKSGKLLFTGTANITVE